MEQLGILFATLPSLCGNACNKCLTEWKWHDSLCSAQVTHWGPPQLFPRCSSVNSSQTESGHLNSSHFLMPMHLSMWIFSPHPPNPWVSNYNPILVVIIHFPPTDFYQNPPLIPTIRGIFLPFIISESHQEIIIAKTSCQSPLSWLWEPCQNLLGCLGIHIDLVHKQTTIIHFAHDSSDLGWWPAHLW